MHGPQCICEICTCGRHQCPHDRAKHANGFSLGGGQPEAGAEEHFYRKKFATVADGGERAQPTRPKGELMSLLDHQQQQSAATIHRDNHAISPTALTDARNERFVTSAALRKRGQNSQIQLGGSSTVGAVPAAMRSTYREESERALLQQQDRDSTRTRATRPTGSTQVLFGNNGQQPETPKTTVHRSEFGAKRSERAQATRPRTSDLWKTEGAMERTSTMRDQFGEKTAPAERTAPFRPRENGPLMGEERTFQRETSNLSEYGPKTGPRAEMHRPVGSELFRSGEPMLERATVNRSDYGQAGRAERAERRVPPQEGAELFRGDGSFLGESTKSADFQAKRGDRFEARVQGSSDIWKSGDHRFEGHGVNREDYGREGRADRFPATRPKESGILKGEGSFTSETHKRVEFGPKRGERAEPKRHGTSDIWKREGATEQESVTRSQYRGGPGERSEAHRPADSDLLLGHGRFESESVARSEFAEKGPGERFPVRRPQVDEVWRREGRMAEGGSVNRLEYTIEGSRGERHEIARRPKEQPLFDPDIETNQLPLSTVHRTEFVQRQGERAERRVPPQEGAELFRGDGSFLSETSKSAEFQPKRGDRFEARVQGSSDIWKTEGKMDGQSVNREQYQQTRGERAEQKRPQESGILKGEGKFTTETHKRAEFGPKRGEKAEPKRPVDSTLFKREGQIGQEGTVQRSDYAHVRGERAVRAVPHGSSGIMVPSQEGDFARRTVTQDEFGEKRLQEVAQMHRPTQNLMSSGGAEPLGMSVSREDFAGKQLPEGRVSGQRRGNESSFGLDEVDSAEWAQNFARTMTQEEFSSKELDERVLPVVHRSELSLADPGATFHSSTMYSDEFREISPASYGTRSHARPSTALKLQGPIELESGYQMEFTNKIKPCPAGELISSVKADHAETDNFQFHAVNKGHHLYKSKENLATAAD